MARKRLRKNAKKYGAAKKKAQNGTKTMQLSNDNNDNKIISNGNDSKILQKMDPETGNAEICSSDMLMDDNNGPVTSAVPLCANANGNRMKTHIRFRPINVTVGREFNPHNDVWRPAMMDIGMDDDQIYPYGLTGLTNLGNTCYMNAAIQALSNCPPFSDFFLSLNSLAPYASKQLDGDGEPPVSRSFRRLLQALWSKERNGCISPQHFLAQVRYHCPQFRGLTQQDAQEFIRCLLDLLHRELCQPVFAWEYRGVTTLNGSRKMDEKSNSGLKRGKCASSRSSSRNSDDDEERYETADSGWSSDGEAPTASKRGNNEMASPVYYRSLVTEVFDGQLRSVVKCLTCHHLSETCETFQDLSLSIPTKEQLERIASHSMNIDNEAKMNWNEEEAKTNDNDDDDSWLLPWWLGGSLFRSIYRYIFGDIISLNDALAAFFSPDDLRGENMYSCEKCAKLRNGVKFCKIINPPEILCIHLKRFRHDLSYSTKVRNTVTFPIHDLDLTPFIANFEENAKPVLYDLVAFITHYGGSAESGHYVAYCKNEMDDNWYEFDDTVVTRLEAPDILTKEAYVLFYQRQSSWKMDDIRIRVRQMLEEEMDGRNKLKVPLHHYISREWLHRFSTFSNPGPITNHDFLCKHSQILPRRATRLTDYYATISSSLWDFLHEKFGGGPANSELHYCLPCQNEYQMMKHKREVELKAFIALEARLKKLKNDIPSLTYGYYMPPNVIVKTWIDRWKAFVEENEFEPPGSIDNSSLLVCNNTNDSRMHLRTSHYIQLPREAWLFFQSIYGGGPELLCIPEDHPSQEELQELIAKVDEKIVGSVESMKRASASLDMSFSSRASNLAVAGTTNNDLTLSRSDFPTDIICSEN